MALLRRAPSGNEAVPIPATAVPSVPPKTEAETEQPPPKPAGTAASPLSAPDTVTPAAPRTVPGRSSLTPTVIPQEAQTITPPSGDRAAVAGARAETTSAGQLLRTFSTAPPTVKARLSTTLTDQVAKLADDEAQSVQSEVPDLHAWLSGAPAPEGPRVVEVPAARPVDVAPVPAVPTPQPRVQTPPPMDAYRPPQDVSAAFNRLGTAGPAAVASQVEASLSATPTSDPALPRSPGPVPSLPLTGANDPALIAAAQATAQDEAATAREEAAHAVVAGPGPERAQPTPLDEACPVGELAVQPVATPLVSAAQASTADGPEAYLSMGLPPEVQASFDLQQQAAMQQSTVGVAEQAEQAAKVRDEARQTAVSDAEAGAAQLNEAANTQQTAAVTTARSDIQAARQDTLDKQQGEVDRVAADARVQRNAAEDQIQIRVAEDQRKIDASYADAQTQIDMKVAEGERRATEEKARAEQAADEESWWDQAVSFVKAAFDALATVIGVIFDEVRRAVNAVLNAVKAAVLALIDAAAAFLKGAIAAFATLLKAGVEGLLGRVFPELAKALTRRIDAAAALVTRTVNTLADRLKAGITALAEKLRAALVAAINACQGSITLALSVVGAAISGDWGALARKVLEALLAIVGVAPETFYAFVGRAQETWQIIIASPRAFLGHVVDAVIGGVRRFAGNIGTHLQAGIVGWLTGALGGAGITPPQTFDLMGVLDLARQVLGLTWDALRAKAAKLVGEKNVQRLEIVYDFIKTLVTEGWPALWAKIMDSVATVRDTVFNAIKEFLVQRVVMAAITKLASLFSPVGAIVQLVITLWNLYTFLRDQLRRIGEVVVAVVNTIGDIARGALDTAVTAVEGVLARLLPIAIDLLARLLGLGNVGDKVREIIEKIRAMVDRGIDAVIQRVAAVFRGDRGGAEQPAAKGPKSPTVKRDALAEAERRLKSASLSDAERVAAIITTVYTAFRPHGLTSLRFHVTDEKTLAGQLTATASEPERRKIDWAQIFGTGDDEIRQLFAIHPRNETHAAIAFNGKRHGEIRLSKDGRHAEVNLLNAYWRPVLDLAKEQIETDPNARPEIAIAINRAPCRLCSSLLVGDLNAVEGRIKSRVRFILAPSGDYTPSIPVPPERLKTERTKLKFMAERLGRAVNPFIKEWLSRTDPTDDATTMADLTKLVGAGWDLHLLNAKAGAPLTTAELGVAEAAHRLAVTAKAKAGTAGKEG
ncbi:hypothetical protein AB0Q95_05250 [Streptomyces sp. NPDC059900]|uniref:hypothetical protein n=1 Tax=Streptomyces sp. NPDC059900 TaxID=3155816 RepID=UPI003439EE64